MPRLYPCNNVEQVCAGLTKAWEFLSGQERSFALCETQEAALGFTEFSYFMPLKLSQDHRTGGIGVLIERPDALGVAAHMFGVDTACLQDADLHDACAEICNLFSDCVALHISDSSDIHMGLPFLASPTDYAQIAACSSVASVYVSNTDNAQLYVVEYHIFSQPH
ncbi:hypothetical protein [Rhodoferax sp. BLA1]|uniref:hypothetical protein n=1 Tax=Rhodoferax sp. BLA1 TaxID=2576062 RepID=UPI0015D1396A|nr:hypothetical protein [Rhodoferax sp. BLA1]